MPGSFVTTAGAFARRLLIGGLGLSACGGVAAFDLQDWMDGQVETGVAAAVVAAEYRDGEVRHHAGGSLTPTGDGARPGPGTGFQIGSITKAFTHLLLAETAAAGQVDYDTTIGSLLEELQVRVDFANPAVAEITLLELATHTSGLPRLPANLAPRDPGDPYGDYSEAQLLAALAGMRENQPLGEHFAYSNFGTGLLGWLLGRVHGGGYRSALRERVLDPLRLAGTSFDPSDDAAPGYSAGEPVPAWRFDALGGAGALWSTSGDLITLARWYLGGADGGLRHEPAADLRIVEERAGLYAVTRVWHVADGEEGPVYWHSGRTGGYGAFLGFRPASGEAVAILVSGDAEPTAAGLQRLGGTARPMETPDPDTSVTGRYRIAPEFDIRVFVADGRLLAQATGQPPLPLTPLGDDWYAIDVADASVRFVRDDDGRTVALELVQNGVMQPAAQVATETAAGERSEKTLSRSALEEYAGEYRINESASFTIRLGDDGLEARLTGQPFVSVYAAGDDRFFYKVVDAELHFERDGDGRVDALVLHQGPIRQRAERVGP